VWVLPVQMTFRLSDTVGKPLSVYMGSWRFYRPGFNDRADQWQHPLVVVNRLAEEGGPDMATTQRLERQPPHGGLAHQERHGHARPKAVPSHLLLLGRRHPQRGGRLDAGPPEDRAVSGRHDSRLRRTAQQGSKVGGAPLATGTLVDPP